MELSLSTLRPSERIAYQLRRLYESYGYGMFRMSKFEEYDFYNRNKDFLSDSRVIAFSDLDGKLMALKPDVTLSIVKNARANADRPEKVYYTESVYRVSRNVREFREIFQIGVEYIGRVTPYAEVEIVTLAAKSLGYISPSTVLDVSHMGFLTGLLSGVDAKPGAREALLPYIEKKSAHELLQTARAYGVSEADAERLVRLCALSGPLPETLEQARTLIDNPRMQAAFDELSTLSRVLSGTPAGRSLRLDFAITNDVTYYNGLMLRGYVEGAPRAVLSGGRYDPLLSRMGKTALEGIGFAIDCDEIERLLKRARADQTDTVVLYDGESDLTTLRNTVEALVERGERVSALTALPESGCGRVLRIRGKQVGEVTDRA